MKVKCINNEYCENQLTIGKTYETIDTFGNWYYIINDENVKWFYDKRHLNQVCKYNKQ